jgi:hypothetical protein
MSSSFDCRPWPIWSRRSARVTWAERPSAALDIPALVLAELEAEGQRLLGDIHVLARAYGWSEAEVVALPPARRRRYVEMVLR